MGNKKLIIFVILLCFVVFFSCKRELPGLNESLFANTQVERMAKAIGNNNLKELNTILQNESANINFQEQKYGNTILMFAVGNDRVDAIKILLKHGADPNIQSWYDSSNATILAAEDYFQSCDTSIMHELIKHNANLNIVQHINRTYENGMHTNLKTTPLLIAIKNNCFNMVKCLVNNGANINVKIDSTGFGAIADAIIYENLGIAKYLIVEKRAKIPPYCFTREFQGVQQKLSVIDLLNEKDYDKSEANYKLKQEILNYLKSSESGADK